MSIIAHPAGPARLAPPITRPVVTPAPATQVETITVYRPASRTRVLLTYGSGGLLIGAAFFTVTASTAGPIVAVILTGAGAALAGIVTGVAVLASGMVEGHADATAAGIADAYRPRPGVR